MLSYTLDLVLLLLGTIVAVICSSRGINQTEDLLQSVHVLIIIVLCFLAVFVTVEIISVIKISDSTMHTVLLSTSLFFYIFFSDDFSHLLYGSGNAAFNMAFNSLHFAFFVATSLSLIYFWNYTFALDLHKKQAAYIIVAAAICVGAYVGLYPSGLHYVAYFAYIATLIGVMSAEYLSLHRKKNATLNFYITETMLYGVVGLSLVDELCNSGLINFSAVGFASFYGVGAVVLFCLEYVTYAMRTDRAALKASEYKLKYETVKAEALRGQIKPHFIFNSLAAIQSLYHKSLSDGDKATSLFSKHLRANIEAANTDLIPFEQELDNIQVYIDLENMRFDKKFNVIFDIDATEFEIPVLSLQPYIENSMRYSKVNQKDDGYIKITSRKTAEGILLELSDNGVGFDVNAVSPASCGIRNSRERFSVLMGIEPTITSVLGQGTTVSIVIPHLEEE